MIRTSLILIILFIFACNNDHRIYEKNKTLSNRLWHTDSVKSFEFDIRETEKAYNFYLNIRNTTAYPYHNIYLTYYLKDSLDHVLMQELINRNLFHPQTGKPLGKSGLGDVFDHRINLKENFNFPEPGKYRLMVEQSMRLDSLPEIISVGARVEVAQ